MGIDIFVEWKGQNERERDEQNLAASLGVDGGRGYLRESYHGEPYATKFLFSEAFLTGEARIPAAVLRERLPHTLEFVEERERKIYGSDEKQIEAMKESFRRFVGLCERKETETGEAVLIVASY